MDDYPNKEDITTTSNFINYPPIQIEENGIKYDLSIETKEDMITFSICDNAQIPCASYIRTLNLKEIKELSKAFYLINSIKNFYDYLKSLSDNKKLNIKKSKDTITLILLVEILLEKQNIEIDLFQAKINKDSYMQNILQELKNKKYLINCLEEENKELKKEIEALRKENEELKETNESNEDGKTQLKERAKNNKNIVIILTSLLILFLVIFLKDYTNSEELMITKEDRKERILSEIENKMNSNSEELMIKKEDEKEWILSEIENKMNKTIKTVKKLYQATIDGGEPMNFHSKCDNIPNTLVLIESEGKRRFGGFTPIPWRTEKGFKKDYDYKTFIFSLDYHKIYYLKEPIKAVYHNKNYGPCFGLGFDIGIMGNPIKDNVIKTYQNSYIYHGDNYLSEYIFPYKIKALDYEVFQVIFN